MAIGTMKLLTSILFCFTALRLYGAAANWYIDPALGTGANDGTSWADAFRTFAAAESAAGSIGAGSTIYLSGGTTVQVYTNSYTCLANGTAANPITITPGVDANHNGLVIIDGWNVRTFGLKLGEYQILDGGATTNLTFTNYVSSTTDRDTTGGTAIWAYHNAVIRRICIADSMNGILATGYTNLNFYSNNITKIHGDYAIRINQLSFTNYAPGFGNLIHDNRIIVNNDFRTNYTVSGSFTNEGGPDGIQGGWGFQLYSNEIGAVWGPVMGYLEGTHGFGGHPDGIQCSGSAGSWSKCFNNFFYNYGNYAIFYDGFASTGRVAFSNFFINGNRLLNTRRDLLNQAIAISGITNQPAIDGIVANNTADGFQVGYAWWNAANLDDQGGFVRCKAVNNLAIGSTSSNIIDINVFTNANIGRTAIQASNDCVVYVYGYTNNNYRLTPLATALIAMGTNMSAYITKDADWVTWSIPWDVGAYKYMGPSAIVSELNVHGTLRVGQIIVP